MTANQLTVFPPEPILTASPTRQTAPADQPDLPNGWQWVKLGDVCEKIMGGGTPSTKNADYWYGDIDWITSADIYGIKDIRPRKKISEKAIENSTTNLLPAGGIIVVTRVGLGKLAVVPHPVCFSQDSQGLVLNKGLITTEYALWCLSEAVQIFKYENRGTTISGVTKKQLVDLKIALPPLAEQQRIVAKVEELFSEIDAGIREVETALQRIKIYRQAVLHHFLNNPNWERVRLGEVADMCLGKMLDRAKNKGTFKPYLRNINVRWGRFELDDLLLMRFEDTEDERYGIEIGDLIVCEGGEPGRAAIWKGETQEAKIQKALHRVRFKPTVQVEFFYYFLLISSYNGYLSKFFTGTTIKHLTSKEFAKFRLPLPDLDTQTQIVQEIEARLSEADALEKTLRTEQHRAERLRQSVLSQAFTGKMLK